MPPCPESVPVHDEVMAWMTRKAKNGHLRLDQEEVTYYIGRRILNSGHGLNRAGMIVQDLIDEGRIARHDDRGYLVLDPLERLDPLTCAPRAPVAIVTDWKAGAMAEDPRVGCDGGAAEAKNFPIEGSFLSSMDQCDPIGAQYTPSPRLRTPSVVLARERFPRVCRENRITLLPGQHSWVTLAHHLRHAWHEKHQLGYETIWEMIREFGRHPQWALRSRRNATEVLMSRRQELSALVATSQKQHEGNRHRHDASWWLL